MKSRRQGRQNAGLTLVELVVVLFILVLVAGTALTATGGLVDSSRYETTATELRHIESALLGAYDSSSSGDSAAISFVADLGRLPRVAAGPAELELRELWEMPPFPVQPFSIQSPPGDPEVHIPAGWRGPYLQLGFGSPQLVDGWGRPYLCLLADGTTFAPVDSELAILISRGANGLDGGVDYDLDLPLVLESTTPPLVGARHRGSVPVRVTHTAAPEERIVVRIYGPRDGDVVTLGQLPIVKSDGLDVVGTFPDIPVGPRVVRAYRVTADPASLEDEITTSVKSRVTAVTVVQGGIPEVLLELP